MFQQKVMQILAGKRSPTSLILLSIEALICFPLSQYQGRARHVRQPSPNLSESFPVPIALTVGQPISSARFSDTVSAEPIIWAKAQLAAITFA